MVLTCPICGQRIRRREYKMGGGRLDCFRCRTSWHIIPISGGVVIRKFTYPARQAHSGTQLTKCTGGYSKHPIKSPIFVRQLPKEVTV